VHRLLSTLIILAVFVALPSRAAAQGVPAPAASASANACAELSRELESSRRALDEAQKVATSAAQEGAECNRDLAASIEKLAQSQASTSTCEKAKERICSSTAAFADELARGQSRGASETGCVSPDQQARLDSLMAGWSTTTTWLSQLAAYQAGESDTLPRPRGGNTPVERILQKLARDGAGSALHHRLLVEALEIISPQAWRKLRARRGTTIDEWFADTAPLDADIVSEAQDASAGASSRSLTDALHLVHAYQVAANCTSPSPNTRGCGRARQLQLLLESTGSLVVRRRVQDIWATECTTISAEVVAPWLEDFPTPHLGKGATAWSEIAEAAHAKLFTCWLDDATAHASYRTWLASVLPTAGRLTGARLQRVDAIKAQWQDDAPEATCARAVRAMQTLPTPNRCTIPSAELRDALDAWSTIAASSPSSPSAPLRVCSALARLLWEGKPASIAGAFPRPPSVDEMVATDKDLPATAMARLREHCDARRGDVTGFPNDLSTLATFARRFGEGTDGTPFRVDPATTRPVEGLRFDASLDASTWFTHVARGTSACSTLGLTDERCRRCAEMPAEAAYDCSLVERLEGRWRERTRRLVGSALLFAIVCSAVVWSRRLRAARSRFASWARSTAIFFDGIGLAARVDRLRNVLPSRYDTVELVLPSEPAWERWGTKAVVVRTPPSIHVVERDVNHAAFVARRVGASVVLLEHDDNATPDLSAVRAQLEWAAKGGSRAVQILPIAEGRARWSKSAHDVLDLVEESSLRGNPFELRGRIATSTQFFNRERLVSGLLAAAQAGHWMVLTGLRRFGKSSLALEVARRLPGASAYVDLAGFDHEVAHDAAASVTASRILRFVCVRLVDAASARWPGASLPAPPPADDALDVAVLTHWFRDLSHAAREASGRPAPLLVIIDEIEQALAVGPKRLAHALEVLAIVIGRLKSAVGDTALPDGGAPIGVFLTSAMHPLLWAPLRSLAHQSIMSSCQRVCVPCLDEDASSTMMRSLGARQGIRFTDAALARMTTESQGVPLLLRRLGASVLELYDAERARQGSLGAVEVGIEGTSEAIEREAREGSPLRVWIESEIAPRSSVAGALLRRLAVEERVSALALRQTAKVMVEQDFITTGIAQTLEPDELARRAEEAAHVTLHLLSESGLLVPYGDLTDPEGYALPDGAIRRVLRANTGISASPSARHAP
jgi:AAA ATPase domain